MGDREGPPGRSRAGEQHGQRPRDRGQQPGGDPWLYPSLIPTAAGGALEPRPPVLQVEPPELPEDVQHWIAYNEASSQLLRAESGLGDVIKDQ